MTFAVPSCIALNALFLHYPFSGTGRYLNNLIDNVGVDNAGLVSNLVLLGTSAFPPAASAARRPVRTLATPFDRLPRPLAKVWFEQVALPREAGRLGAAVAHNPYFAAPLYPRVPTVVTVHDLVPIIRPEYRRTAAQRLYTALVTRGLRSACRIITDSVASAGDLHVRLKIPETRIRVIPLGVNRQFRPLETEEDQSWARTVLARYRLDRPYVFYIGGLDRRKNVDVLLRAFARLKRERGVPHALVIVAALRPGDALFYDPRPDAERLGIADSMVLPGRVDDDDVRALHARADAFVFPSAYEGFGLPPLEAMACGAPVICSDASSLPEVVGDAGVLFDHSRDDALEQALWSVLSDADLRQDLRRRGPARAATFTWEKTARATAEVWQDVASEWQRQ